MEAKVDIGGPVFAQMNVAVHLHVRLFELGLSGDPQLRSLGNRVNGELARAILVEGKVVQMDGGIERGLFQSSRPGRGKIRTAGHGDSSALQHGYTGQVKIVSRKAKTKSVTGVIVGGAAGDTRFVVRQLNVLEFSFLSVEIQIRSKALDRFAVNTAVAQHDVALPLRGGPCARDLQVEVHGSGDRV